jgi:hypothetical protein
VRPLLDSVPDHQDDVRKRLRIQRFREVRVEAHVLRAGDIGCPPYLVIVTHLVIVTPVAPEHRSGLHEMSISAPRLSPNEGLHPGAGLRS